MLYLMVHGQRRDSRYAGEDSGAVAVRDHIETRRDMAALA